MAEEAGRVLGRCRLEELIGRGSMGEVWKARHLTLGIHVAVKILREPAAPDNALRFRERLRREAHLAARLSHPGLVRVLDYGEEGRFPYIVMEFVDGTTLDACLRRQGRLRERTALLVLTRLAEALAVAHAAGVMHRDIKPANILVDREGRMKIADLGLAREIGSSTLTGNENTLGTPLYMAPECFTRQPEPDARADIYALGILLYEMLAGTAPFVGTPARILHQHLHEEPDWTRIASATHAQPVARALLAKSPAMRPADAGTVARLAAGAAARSTPPSSPPPPPRVEVGQPAAVSQLPSSGSGDPPEIRLIDLLGERMSSSSLVEGRRIVHIFARERIVLALLALALALLVVVGFAFAR